MSDTPGWTPPASDGGGASWPPPTGEPLAPAPASSAPLPPGYPPPGYPAPGYPPPGYPVGAVPGWGAAPPPLYPGTPWGGPPPAPKPGVVPLRPLGVGEILDASITYIRQNPRATLGIAAVVAVVDAAVQLPFVAALSHQVSSLSDTALQPSTGTGTPNPLNGALTSATLVGNLTSWIVQLVATGMLTFVMGQAVLGRQVTARAAWTRARSVLWRLLGVSLLTGVLVVLALVVCLVPGLLVLAAGGGSGAVALLVVGGIAGFALLVWVYVRLSLASPTLVLENVGVVQSLRRSASLVRGSWWRVFGITLLASILASLIGSIIALPFRIAVGFDSTAGVFALVVGGAVASVVTLPFRAGVTSLLYVDRRIRREGLDLELARAAGVGPSAAAAAPSPSAPPPSAPPPSAPPWAQQW